MCIATCVAIRPTAPIPRRCSKRIATTRSTPSRSSRSTSRPSPRSIVLPSRPGSPTRTARLNALRGLCREFGVSIPVGARRASIPAVRAQADGRWPTAAAAPPGAGDGCAQRSRRLEAAIVAIERQLAALAAQMPDVIRLQTIPGIGLLTASAVVARIGDAARFPDGRHFASALGLTAKEASSGLQRRLGGISKRGERLPPSMLLIQRRPIGAVPREAASGSHDPLCVVGAADPGAARPQCRGRRAGQ